MGAFTPQSKQALHKQAKTPGSGSLRSPQQIVVLAGSGILLSLGLWVVLVVGEYVTIGGVPFSVIVSFLQDNTARTAYFEGNSTQVHDRLSEMGVEEQMKGYYRDRIADEVKLDQHIHQVLYDRTGYVGQAYRVNAQGILVLRQPVIRP
ncbi:MULTISPECIES: hypothetical protein [Trichocoleus]|uniref:hypothetical protein n=1 Tax=Trichocoleus TaxID=450526 RepID=UPI001685219B|nr:hypothetical protein [Trichocoleus sp. FACHB-262]MBD2123196.1 hypothetical protein [Trichocoleus sp. FACHB-262]